jgi:hypothetical protein
MDPFYNGPLRPFTDKLRAVTGLCATPALPDVFADTGEVGRIARALLIELHPRQQELVATFCANKLHEARWVRNQHNREVAKVILDEVSASAAGPAQELGLAFTTALGRVDAPWMQILVNLELAELLSRTHVYAPSCALAYLQTFRCFDRYLAERGFIKGPKVSLFEPIALAQGDQARAHSLALQAALPYGEDALRLLWGLQARDEENGNVIGLKVLRAEEIELATRLQGYLDCLDGLAGPSAASWRSDLIAALAHSRAGDGPEQTKLRDTSRSKAVALLVSDARALVDSAHNNEAERVLIPLVRSLSKDDQRETTKIRDHLLEAGYLLALVTYRNRSESPRRRHDLDTVRRTWRNLERAFHEVGSLWPRTVVEARGQALHEIPRMWRETPKHLPI